MLFSKLLFFLVLFSVMNQTSVFAAKQTYIVYMGVHQRGLQVGDINRVNKIQSTHSQFLASFLESTKKAKEAIIHSYTGDINGFAAVLDEDQAALIAKHPGVVSVFLNKAKKLHTSHSWEFLSLEKPQGQILPSNSLWKQANYGEDIIIANLDTGVWPESKSFSNGNLGPVPSRWKGFCQNDTKTGVPCNRKLIGARYFNTFFNKYGGDNSPWKDTARDHNGHGSHTLSTAAGNFVHGVTIFGALNGTVKGGAPNARVASYKVCWPGGCIDGDTLDGFEAAIEDGVDVLSVSVAGQPYDYSEDTIAIGSFHAVKKGIVVVCAAGNKSPWSRSITNVAPWILTVTASTMDREFTTNITLGNGKHYQGKSITKALPRQQLYPLISSENAKARNAYLEDAILCKSGTLDAKKVKGKILTCLRGDNNLVDKGIQAARAGAVGMILYNSEDNDNNVVAKEHFLPTSHISYKDGRDVLSYINSTKNPVGYISASEADVNIKPAPRMASFSSRGPNTVTPGILKPDITAPGVDVIAAFSRNGNPTEYDLDTRHTSFATLYGTSISCPHVAGVVGLLKKVNPDWSPAAIKSAIMTTATTRDNTRNTILDAFGEKGTPFDFGAGHIRPVHAADPGLVYDLGTSDYLYFLCAIGYNQSKVQLFSEEPYECPRNADLLNFNYPSISVPNLGHYSVTVRRTVKNVGSPGVYTSRLRHPRGVLISVEPSALEFTAIGEEKSFELTLQRVGSAKKERDSYDFGYEFGELVWSDGNHFVRSPIAIGQKVEH